MEKEVFAGIYLIVMSLMAILFFRAITRKHKMSRPTSRLIGAGTVCIIGYVIYLSTSSFTLMKLGNCIMFASIDWVCYFFLLFVVQYTGFSRNKTFLYKILPAVIVVDSAQLLSNTLYESSIHFDEITVGGSSYVLFEGGALFYVHLIISYMFIVEIVAILVRKSLSVTRLYRAKYLTIVVALLFVIAWNGIFLIVRGHIDLSIVSYALLAWFIYFYVFNYKGVSAGNATKAYFIEEMNTPVVQFDNEGYLLSANRRARDLFGLNEIISERAFLERSPYIKIPDAARKYTCEATITSGGRVYYFQIMYSYFSDEKNRRIGSIYVYDDITDKKKAQIQNEFNAVHDALTGTFSRNYIYSFKQEIRERNKYPVLGAVYNITGLRKINEEYGTEIGDKALRRIAWFLQQYSGALDYVIRMDGGEFMLAITGSSERKAMDTLKKIEKRVSNYDVDGYEVTTEYAYFTMDDIDNFDSVYEEARSEINRKKGKLDDNNGQFLSVF